MAGLPKDVSDSSSGQDRHTEGAEEGETCKEDLQTHRLALVGSEAARRSVAERILSKVRILDTPCWVWDGSDSGNGYGRISIDGKTKATHIALYELFKGPVPEGMVLDHLCLNRRCCNPDHLDPKTPLENTLIGSGPTAKNARKEECKRGHPLKGDNLILRKRNGRTHRECRLCKKLRTQKNKATRENANEKQRTDN